MDALPPAAPPLLGAHENLRTSMATSTLAAMKSPNATPLCRVRLLHALYRLLGAKHLLEASLRSPVPQQVSPRPQSIGSGNPSEKEGILPSPPAIPHGQDPVPPSSSPPAIPHGQDPVPPSSWWDDVYRTLKPSLSGLGSRRLSGLLYLLAKMVDVTGTQTSTSAPRGFEGPPVDWVEEALHFIAGERV